MLAPEWSAQTSRDDWSIVSPGPMKHLFTARRKESQPAIRCNSEYSTIQCSGGLQDRSLAALVGMLSAPSCSSVTLWEETAPVKLPTTHCPGTG